MVMNAKVSRDKGFKEQKLAKTRQRRERLRVERDQSSPSRSRNDLLPNLQVCMVEVAQLRSSPHRVRRETDAQVGRLIASISDMGFPLPILIRENEIIDGHIRVAAARRLGLDAVPAIEVAHLTDAEVRKLRLALNRTAELGEWDLDQLRIEIGALVDLDIDLSSTGFTPQEIDIVLLDELDGQDGQLEDKAAVPEVPDRPVSRLGDIWQLGDHRVLCGNSLEADAYAVLLGGERVHAVLTDGPFNVRIEGNVSGLGKTVHKEFAMASGELNDAEWQAFLDTVMTRLTEHMLPGAVAFAFMDWRSIHRLYQAGFAAGLNLLNLVVWYKQSGGMGSFLRSAHELVAVFCKGATPRVNNVELGRHGRNRDNVWVAAGANRRGSSANAMLEFHATPKPVELCVDALLDVTNRGETVLDAFLGSGTTLIAAEKAGRRCCGIEIDPGFVDVIVRRWEQFTGKHAVLAATGEPFATIAQHRSEQQPDEQMEAGHE